MSQIRTVKEANNIVEVIGERIKLDAAGINYKACCPFHGEKTPSFFVNPSLQRYRCFGCGVSGDVLDFLQNFDGSTFYEALKTLADRAGITLQEFQRTREDEEREILLEILSLAKEYYHFLLTKHEVGQVGRAYLQSRGTTSESIKIFQLGVASSAWDSLLKYLHHKKNYSLEQIEKTGLIIKGKGGRYYDRFRERLMFPLKNHRGQVVGFSGRSLSQDVKEAKYINSPETALYHKSQLLYGYSELFREIKKKEQVIVVEGEFDMISSTQAHVNHVVAIKGSALTQEQITLLSRVAKTIILSLDADEAGVKAMERAIPMVKAKGLDLKVIDLKHSPLLTATHRAKDPDELAREQPKLWRELTESAVSVYEFLQNHALDVYDSSKPDGQRQIINYLAPIFETIDHSVEKEFYIQRLAKALNVRESLLKADLTKFGTINKSTNSTPQSAVPATANAEPNTPPASLTQSEAYLFFLLFRFTKDQFAKALSDMQAIQFSSSVANRLREQLQQLQTHHSSEQLLNHLAEDLKQVLMEALAQPAFEAMVGAIDLDKEWSETLRRARREAVLAEIKAINEEINALDSVQVRQPEQEARLNELLAAIVQKQNALKKAA